jgi:hypothetical protein
MRGLFRPLEEYASPSILTVDVLCFVLLLGCMLECFQAGFSSFEESEYVCFYKTGLPAQC